MAASSGATIVRVLGSQTRVLVSSITTTAPPGARLQCATARARSIGSPSTNVP